MKREPMEVHLDGTSHSLESLLPSANEQTPARIEGIVIGRIDAVLEDGRVLVQLGGAPPVAARSLVPLALTDQGRAVALSFEQGEATRPLVMGLIWQGAPVPALPAVPEQHLITADNEVVIRCGEASITLTRDGKILLRGAYISSQAKGTNRVKGGSVRMN